MRTYVFALRVHVSVAALADLEGPEVMLFADGVLAGPTRHLPPEAAIAVLAQAARTCPLLEI
jgi:hypothetical protein